MNAYIVAGLILAGWAVLVSLLGMRGFPRGPGGQRIAIAITAVLFAVAVTSAIADQNKVGERRGPEIDKPGEGPESAKPGQPTGGGEQKAPPSGASAAPKDEGEQKDRGKPTALTLTADPGGLLKFDKASLQATAGHVTITMTNPSSVPHNVSLRGNGVNEQGKTVQGDGKSVVQADLQPGQSYEYYCSIPGHFQGGMKGTLTVK
jgi:plastocyanin